MTVNQFALVTGFSRGAILNACRSGRLPCDFYRGRYEISPRYVPVWKAKKNKQPITLGGKNIHNSVTMYQRALDEYNRINGTDLSYGQAVAMGVITDE